MSWFKASTATALAQAVRLLSGLVVIKLLAITLGVEGFGRLGHFMSLISILSVLAGGGVLNGLVKYVAEYRHQPQRLTDFLSAAALYSLLFSLANGFFLILFSDQIALFLFENRAYGKYIIFLAIIQFGYGLVSFCNGILNGLTKTAIFAKVSVIGSLIGLPISSFLIWQFGLTGAVLGLALINVCMLPAGLVEIIKLGLFKNIRFYFHSEHLASLSKFSLMQVTSLATLPLAEIVIRKMLADHFGWQEVGLWQSLMRLSAVYLSFFTMFLASYYMPVVSGMTNKKQTMRYVLKTLCAVGGIFFLMANCIYVFRSEVLSLIFSSEFYIPSSFVQYQLIGDFFKICSYVIAFYVVAKAHASLYIAGELVQTGLYLGLGVVFIQAGQMQHVFIAYAISNFLYCCVCFLGLLFFMKRSSCDA